MVEQLLDEFEQDIESVGLIPSGGGAFEVVVDGDLVYSKKATGRHAEGDEVLERVREVAG